jgi:hypothetical protein
VRNFGKQLASFLADLSLIYQMKQQQNPLAQIKQETGVELEVLKQFLPEVTVKTLALTDMPPPTTHHRL